jgi:inosine-uridine nucleoside N-ribohydrolase
MQKKIHSISFMGGAIGVGNMSPAAEFNILADPEAARIVLGNSREDLPVYMVCVGL